ncbi:MAG: hypothetical protein EZS28_032764, partial [Streblomastix strix]
MFVFLLVQHSLEMAIFRNVEQEPRMDISSRNCGLDQGTQQQLYNLP